MGQAAIVGPTNSTVLVLSETGTGKGRIASMLHNLSPRRDHTFVKVNCAAIPLGLLESELFGHERGAFTGAIARRIGRFELASKGTLFLDEIGDIPPELEPKLLRVLQEHEFERLGSTHTNEGNTCEVCSFEMSDRRLQTLLRPDEGVVCSTRGVYPLIFRPAWARTGGADRCCCRVD